MLGEDVDLDVDDLTLADLPEVRSLLGLRYQRHREPVLVQRAHGQADAVDRDRSLLHQIASQARLDVDLEHAREPLLADRANGAGAVDVALDDVSAEAI